MQKVNWARTRDILFCVIAIGLILSYVWGLMALFVHAIIILLLSMAVAFLLTPAVNFLSKYMPRLFATLLIYVIVLVALGAFSSALVFSLIQQTQAFSEKIVTYAQQLPQISRNVIAFLKTKGVSDTDINTALSQIQSQATGFAQSTATNIVTIFFSITSIFLDTLLVLVLSFYLTIDGKRIRDSIFNILPESWLPHAHLFEDALNRVVGNYIRGQLTLAAIIGLLAGGGCAFLGLSQFALIIGVLAFLFETIPMVGPGLASIPAIVLSLLLPDPFPRTFWIILYFVAIQAIESNILGPRIVGHAVGLHPVASILALIIGAQLFGAFGALLATPILAAAWVVIASIYRSARGETADQMLAKRRTPWVIRPNPAVLLRRRRTHTLKNGHHSQEGRYPQQERPGYGTTSESTKNTTMSVEHMDLLRPVPDSPGKDVSVEAEVGSGKGSSSLSVEHMNLLRPIPAKEDVPDTPKE